MPVNDNTIVRLMDGPREVWRGTIAALERENGFDDAEAAVVRTDLHIHGRHGFGGGAAGTYVIELVSAGWIVTAITRSGREACRYETGEAAQIAAFIALASRAVVTIVGPDGEYMSVMCPTAPDRHAVPATA